MEKFDNLICSFVELISFIFVFIFVIMQLHFSLQIDLRIRIINFLKYAMVELQRTFSNDLVNKLARKYYCKPPVMI